MIDLNKFLFSTFAIFSFLVPSVSAQDAEENVEEVIIEQSTVKGQTEPIIVHSKEKKSTKITAA